MATAQKAKILSPAPEAKNGKPGSKKKERL